MVITPKHDNCKGSNIIETQGALTKINLKYIKNVNKTKKPSILKQNFITVLIGGNSRHHKITNAILNQMISKLNLNQKKNKIKVFILFSRRTNKNDFLYLKKNLFNKNFIFILPTQKKFLI